MASSRYTRPPGAPLTPLSPYCGAAALLTHSPPGRPAAFAQQAILTAALRIASTEGGSENDWRDLYRHVAETEEHRTSPLWASLPPQDDSALGGPLVDFSWDQTEERFSMPDPGCPSAVPAECERWERFKSEMSFVDEQLSYKKICVPKDSATHSAAAPCERVVAGFPWVWQHGNLLRFGWHNASAATHLVGMNYGWGDKGTSSGGLSGRVAWLVANGYTDERVIPSPPEDGVLVMVRARADIEPLFFYLFHACVLPMRLCGVTHRTR